MDLDELRERIKAASRRVGLSFDEAAETTVFSSELLDRYLSPDAGIHGVAAFRLEAFLTSPKNWPLDGAVAAAIAQALRRRMEGALKLKGTDLKIGLQLNAAGCFNRDDLVLLVRALKGVDDFAVAAAAPTLLPLIGTAFIQDYLTSTALFETGGMGGPMRPLIQEMAAQALRDFQHRA